MTQLPLNCLSPPGPGGALKVAPASPSVCQARILNRICRPDLPSPKCRCRSAASVLRDASCKRSEWLIVPRRGDMIRSCFQTLWQSILMIWDQDYPFNGCLRHHVQAETFQKIPWIDQPRPGGCRKTMRTFLVYGQADDQAD